MRTLQIRPLRLQPRGEGPEHSRREQLFGDRKLVHLSRH